MDVDCFGSYKGTCVLLVVDAGGTDEFPENALMIELSKKYRNDPFSFVWIDGGVQSETANAFGVKKRNAPSLVAVKSGKRNRFAVLNGPVLDEAVASVFLDKILGGDMQFKPIKALPALEPEYLRGDSSGVWKDDDDDDEEPDANGVEVRAEDGDGEEDVPGAEGVPSVDIDALLDVDEGAVAAAPDSSVEDE